MRTKWRRPSKEKLEVTLKGKLDTTTAPQFESEITGLLYEGKDVIIDVKDLLYISSAGLRVLVMVKISIGRNGALKLRNVSPEVKEILEVTGFSSVLD